jgi:BolA protein
MTIEEKIKQKIYKEFSPTFFEIINNSHLHNSHFKAPNQDFHNQTHFLIKISAPIFAKQKKLDIHRQINNLLKDEFAQGLHALEIKII